MDHFEAFEAGFATPFLEIGAGVIERFAEFDQHVEGHEQAEDVFPAGSSISASRSTAAFEVTA